MLQSIQRRTRQLLAGGDAAAAEPFPSLLVRADGSLEAQGDFAVAQVQYLQPDLAAVERLAEELQRARMGVVAHFYMDPQVQGVLTAARRRWPHIAISDSLVMADGAVRMVEEGGCRSVAVLGVDFMAENARAILDRAGHADVPVYRMAASEIGCSLADAASSATYETFLEEAARTPCALHVIYINTSLDTKARAHALVPTITCTSSNVLQTVLQAFAQVPDVTVYYGPDTYMGRNLAELVRQLAQLSDEDIAAVHPQHNRRSLAALLPRLHYYEEGACVVHDLFGASVVDRVRQGYSDAYQTAHFEVPGEMFALAMEARERGMGVVGSTQNILDFVALKTREVVERRKEEPERLQFVLGTESGMITSLVACVRAELARGAAASPSGRQSVEVEIVFPVASEAITQPTPPAASVHGDYERPSFLRELKIVPGVTSGEGCSVSGGCASCPYMKMNTLDSLLRVARLAGTPGEALLAGQSARTFKGDIQGRAVAELGCEPILHMRSFQKSKKLPESLIDDIIHRQHVLSGGN
eukprot:SM000018S03741  [mRNA]  locus=s18:1048945:1051009:- [translate_table: standard]